MKRPRVFRCDTKTRIMADDSRAVPSSAASAPHVSALRESEQRFHATFEQAAVGMAHRDADGQFIRVNRKFCDFTGYTSQELTNRTVFDIIHPDELERHTHLARRLVAREIDHYTIEQRYVRKSGSIIWGRVTVTAVRDEADTIAFHSVVVQDVTERRQLMLQLDEERRFITSIIDTAPVIILVLDADGRIVLFNTYFQMLSGYALEEVKGMDWLETFIPPDERDRVSGVLSNALSGVRTHGNVNAIHTREGRTRTIRWFDAELCDESRHPNGIVAIGQDITDQR
jgi:PAS domain S-box-containing protein